MSKKTADNSQEKQEQWRHFWESLSPNTDHRTMQLMGAFYDTAHTLRHLSEQSLRQSGLSAAQYRILMLLMFAEQFEDSPAMNPSTVSLRQGISRNTVSSLIANLEKEQLIERELDRKDKRRFLIKITDRGRDLVHAHARQHFATLEENLRIFSAEEKETIFQLLQRLNQPRPVR